MQWFFVFRPLNTFLSLICFGGILACLHAPLLYHYPAWLTATAIFFTMAAGNLMNDLYDTKADKINKPHKTYIENGISRTQAVVAVFSGYGAACIISAYLFAKGYVLIASTIVLALSILWLYNVFLKRKPFWGALCISLLVGLVPLLAYVLYRAEGGIPWGHQSKLVLYFSSFAILTNLMRELAKQIIDLRGDRAAGYRTTPIVWGVKATQLIVLFCAFVLAALLVLMAFQLHITLQNTLPLFVLLVLAACLIFLSIGIVKARTKPQWKFMSSAFKLFLLIGIFCFCLLL